ncbi:MAG: glycosyltransferase, partial [Thermoguttaceae bacterium]|nr:glycosyltransferase [Thermoguttaceae bacterium]
MKILLLLNKRLTDNFGGTEKVFCNFANEFVRRGHVVAATHNDKTDLSSTNALDPRVQLFNLNGPEVPRTTALAAKIWREATRPFRKTFLAPLFPDFYLNQRRRLLKPRIDGALQAFRPDVVVAFFTEELKTLFFERPTNDFATILMAHNVPWISIPSWQRENGPALDRCDAVQALLPSFIPAIRAQCSTEIVAIPNVVPQFAESVDVDEREKTGSPRVVFAARLDAKSKRQHLAIEAFAKIAEDAPGWNLHFFGSDYSGGAYRSRLEKLIQKRKLDGRVFIQDSTPAIVQELLASDIVAFPSAFEGFSLALTEAQSLGLPVVGFADAPSVNELIV